MMETLNQKAFNKLKTDLKGLTIFVGPLFVHFYLNPHIF